MCMNILLFNKRLSITIVINRVYYVYYQELVDVKDYNKYITVHSSVRSSIIVLTICL